MIKKTIFTLLALCLCGTMWAQDSQYGLYYTVSGDEATIVAPTNGTTYSNSNLATYTGDEVAEGVTAVTIPEYVDGYAVVAVGEKAFQAATIEGHFVLPGYVNTVGAGAFMDCASITDVTIEYSSTTLTDQNTAAYTNMFYNNTSLKTVTLNRNISSRTSSAYAPFSYQHTLTTITIGAHVSSIPDMMFRDDKYNYTITSVTCYAQYPPSMSTSAAPFDRCFRSVGAVPLYVPSTSIQDYLDDTTWAGVFGDNIQEIEGYVVPDEEQPEGTLRDVDTGLYFEINDGVVSIVKDASGTYTSDNLVAVDGEEKTYTFPSYVEDKSGTSGYVTRIDASAFSGSLISGHLVIPATILYIGKSAFQNCTGLTEVTYEYSETALEDENSDQTASYSFEGCTGVKTVNLYRNVNIGSSTRLCAPFCYTTSITKVNVGENVTVIPSYMFRNTNNACLTEVYCYATSVPTTTFDPFSNLPSSGCTLYVPKGCKDTYDTAEYSTRSYSGDSAITWGEFFTSIEEMEGEGTTEPEPEEGPLCDLATGLYFDIDDDGVVSIIAPEEGVYSNDNLVATDDGAYTLPAQVSATEVITYAAEGTYDVTRVDASAFANSSISGHLVIPATITAVGEKAFQNCTGLTEVTYEYSETALQDESAGNNTGTQSFNGCSGVTTVHMNRDITIGHSGYLCAPFCYNTSVTTVYIGENVTLVPDYMFRNTNTKCLAEVYCYATSVPSTNYDPFGTLPESGCTLYVSNGYKDIYSSASYASSSYKDDSAITWGEYFNIVELGSEESGGTFVCVVSPESGSSVDELYQNITFYNPTEGGEIYVNDYCEEFIEVYSEDETLVTRQANFYTDFGPNWEEYSQTVIFEDRVSDEGTYYVIVPAELFVIYDEDGNALYNEAMTLTYIVSADATVEPDYTLNISPESGSILESLSSISITCEDGIVWNTLGWSDVVIYDGNGNELDNEVTWEEVASSSGAVTEVILTVSPAITADGDYIVEIPEGYFLVSGTVECKAITLAYTISTSTGIRGISINDENVEGIYSTAGQKLNTTAKGVNIIRFTDGSVKKLYVK